MSSDIVVPENGASMPVAGANLAALNFLASRRSSSASTLGAPGPDAKTLRSLLQLAAHVPDHGKLAPWRFIVLEGAAKDALVVRLESLATTQENPTKAAAALAKLRTPPTCVAVVSRVSEGKIPVWEQQMSAGAACMSLLMAAHAAGFGANWITDWYAYDASATRLLGLAQNERIAGFIYLGTQQEVPKERPRPELSELISHWRPDAS